MGPLFNSNKETCMVKFIKELAFSRRLTCELRSLRRQVGWLQAFGFVGPWQGEWWRIVYHRVVPAKLVDEASPQTVKHNG